MPPDPLPIEPLRRPFDLTIADLPGSKSLTNRALLLAALADGPSTLTNVLFADDTRVMMQALRELGFELAIDEPRRTVVVHGRGGAIPASRAELHLGNAGTAMRFLTAACCVGPDGGEYILDGVPRMRQRPIAQLVDPLRELGATIEYLGDDGCPPLRIRPTARLRGGTLRMTPTVSSQYVSALLQIGGCCARPITLVFAEPIVSEPYVLMTLELMRRFGSDVPPAITGSQPEFASGTPYHGTDYAVEPDASNASYFLAAAAVTPGATCAIDGLGRASLQGDARFAEVLGQMGADVVMRDASIRVTGPPRLDPIDIDLNTMPDMAQTLAVVALFAAPGSGPTTIRNVGNLRVKETDRLAALRNELTKLGAQVAIEGDDITITPPPDGKLQPADIETYDDHRMAMSFALAGLRSAGVRICDPACVNKTFPEYWSFLERLRG